MCGAMWELDTPGRIALRQISVEWDRLSPKVCNQILPEDLASISVPEIAVLPPVSRIGTAVPHRNVRVAQNRQPGSRMTFRRYHAHGVVWRKEAENPDVGSDYLYP